MKLALDGSGLTLEDLHAAAEADRLEIELDREALSRVNASARAVEELCRGDEPVYGVNTGFGRLAGRPVDGDDLALLQRNLIVSHAVGVGEPLPDEEVRLILLLRIQALLHGCSGVRESTVRALAALVEHDILPLVPRQGSVGASGDLAPLAHCVLALIGEGRVRVGGREMTAAKALEDAGLEPVALGPKEGLALVNGTQMMTAVGGLAAARAVRLCRQADLVGCMSLEALKGSAAPFDKRIHAVRPHRGQRDSATNLRLLLRGSAILEGHRDCEKVQDPYSLRCMPQVHGAVRDALAHVRRVLEIEMNSATDNPLIFEDKRGPTAVSGGNFHGQPVSLALDHAAAAVAALAGISERRIEQMVNPDLSGLPAFLTPEGGLNSGMMMVQVTAASLVSENKTFAHPASVDSIPTSANQEDFVSMGPIAARKLRRVLVNTSRVLAIEALCAAQGLDFQELEPGPGVAAARARLRRDVRRLTEDRLLGDDLRKVEELVFDGHLLAAAEEALDRALH